jgi:RNA polymerase sigma-70 factor, ECF subfamily
MAEEALSADPPPVRRGVSRSASTPDDSDDSLLRAHVAGDRRALEYLFLRHRTSLWHAALRLLRQHDDAEDALQEALTRAFLYAHTYRGEASVKTWLHRIVMNSARSIRARRPLRYEPDEAEQEPEDPSGGLAIEEIVVGAALRADLGEIPPMLRDAFMLCAYLGFTHEETAELLAISVGTVKSRVWRARKHLLAVLAARDDTKRTEP